MRAATEVPERRKDPFVRRHSGESIRGLVETALQAVVVAAVGAWVDIGAVDADRRRPEKALRSSVVTLDDAALGDLNVDAFAFQQMREALDQRLMVRAAVEVQNLDRCAVECHHRIVMPP